MRRLSSIAALGLAAFLGLQSPASAAQQVSTSTDPYAGEIEVPANKSQILRIDQPYRDLLIGNPDIADVRPMSDRSVYILGKKPGSTTLSIYGANKQVLGIMDVSVVADVDAVKKRLYELLPDEKIAVRAVNGSIVLSGTVIRDSSISAAVALAKRYVDQDNVVNLLQVQGSQQVMLAVRFVEVKRSAARELGFNNNVLFQDGTMAVQLLTGAGQSLDTFGSIAANAVSGKWNISSTLDALERNGIIKTLAEPNLIALSGETASFLAGGEFPIPVAQTGAGLYNTITIEFKEFGVSLAFTPTVLGDGLISLKVAPEVSAIDPNASIKLANFEIPGFTTRRAKTTIDLRDGQSFAIAGLLQRQLQNQIRALPGLGNLPVLGALFRSTQFQNDETELVIIVTPHLVRPAGPNQLVTPDEYLTSPSDADLFLMGKTEGPSPARTGGLDGRVGPVTP